MGTQEIITKKISRKRLLIKIESAWALLSTFGLFFLIAFGDKMNVILSSILAIFFIIGISFGYYSIFWHNKQLYLLNKNKAFNLNTDEEATKASWWLHGL